MKNERKMDFADLMTQFVPLNKEKNVKTQSVHQYFKNKLMNEKVLQVEKKTFKVINFIKNEINLKKIGTMQKYRNMRKKIEYLNFFITMTFTLLTFIVFFGNLAIALTTSDVQIKTYLSSPFFYLFAVTFSGWFAIFFYMEKIRAFYVLKYRNFLLKKEDIDNVSYLTALAANLLSTDKEFNEFVIRSLVERDKIANTDWKKLTTILDESVISKLFEEKTIDKLEKSIKEEYINYKK